MRSIWTIPIMWQSRLTTAIRFHPVIIMRGIESRDAEGNPLYPQQKVLLGPGFSSNGPGCKQNGLVQAKVLIVAALMDEQAYPWQADWYRRKIASVHDGNEKDYCRLWYFDNVLHDDRAASVDELDVTTYAPGLSRRLWILPHGWKKEFNRCRPVIIV